MVAGGLAMDPTHPAIKERIRETAERFKRLGYEYIKIDFLTHGCAEADYYYDPEVQTGMQAYNKGMAYLLEQMEGMYITMAISPLFPSQYAHSSCRSRCLGRNRRYRIHVELFDLWVVA